MKAPLPARIKQIVPIVDFLILAAGASAKAARASYRKRLRRPRGHTLRPGPETPLWNEVVLAAREQLSAYGAKARLARILGVPRQRVHQYLRASTACPDAERTLLLLAWVQARRNGRDLL
jgi:hypothetical protein